jgi:hypothetical protein
LTQTGNPAVVADPTVETDSLQLHREEDVATAETPLVLRKASTELEETESVQRETEGRGFFKRIFRKLRQH